MLATLFYYVIPRKANQLNLFTTLKTVKKTIKYKEISITIMVMLIFIIGIGFNVRNIV